MGFAEKDKAYRIGFEDGYRARCREEERFRWHDLRKNPEDLPKLLDEVLVCAEDSYGNREYVVATKVEQEVKQDSMVFNGWSCLGFVIAWRYIEPFEDEA